ncbi:unnamed protein product [Oppiella nova]|uniref:Uncharacterized protein n=1 Tax=Oppiella nova TaxID=334625 RepID=A0A7R9QMN2_9ACAR|nr:unnamed protein product [Oppiella nova]CAG2168620.1 unnamed protein product [Oppiella nova]
MTNKISYNAIDSTTTSPNDRSLDQSIDTYDTNTTLDIPDTFPDTPVDMDFNNQINSLLNDSIVNIYEDYELRQRVEQEFPVIPFVDRPIADHRNQLNELEGYRLQELVSVFGDLSHPLESVSVSVIYREVYETIGTKLEQLMLNVIKICQKLSTFTSICEEDRMSLIKYGCIDLSYMWLIPKLDYYQDHWKFTILTAIILFSADRPNLKHRHIVQ